jgi:tetratricopeptide (TPR) repeat protein
MFKKTGIAVLVSYVALATGFAIQDPQTQTQSAPPSGRAGSQAELDAWKPIADASALAEKAALAKDFLKQFPNSGLTPNAHYLIAMNYYQEGQVQDFIQHAEIAVSELPRAFDLLSHLAFYYAETHEPDKAVSRANAALSVLNGLQKPSGVSAEQWVSEMAQVRAEINYSLGRAYLEWSFKTKDQVSKADLQKAIQYFETALKNDPQHDFANFRMATAVRNTGDVKRTLMYYGRCVAIGGSAAAPARQQLEEVLQIIKKSLPDSEWAGKSVDEIVAAARLELLQSVADTQAEREHEIELLKNADALKASTPVATPENEPASPPPPGR